MLSQVLRKEVEAAMRQIDRSGSAGTATIQVEGRQVQCFFGQEAKARAHQAHAAALAADAVPLSGVEQVEDAFFFVT